MFKKLGIVCLFILTFTGLIACNDEVSTTTDDAKLEVEEADTIETNTKEEVREEPEEEELVEPNREEVQQLVQDTINNIHNVMQTEVNRVGYSWTTEEEYKALQNEIRDNTLKPLGEYVAEPSVITYAEAFAEVMTCQCDSLFLFTERDTFAGFTVTEYTENSFEAESVTINEAGFYEVGWKNDWKFVKENDHWKLQEHTFTFPNFPEEPVDEAKLLDITFEDIEQTFRIFHPENESYSDEFIPIEFVEEIEQNGTRYLVIQMPEKKYSEHGREPGSYIVYNTELGIEDMELTQAYNN